MKKIILLSCFVAYFSVIKAATFYVSTTGDGTDGSSWATAFKTIQDALSSTSVTSGSEVWVQVGTYTPGAVLKWKDGVSFFGGFSGNEIVKEQRNADPALTIIEGDNTFQILRVDAALNTITTWNGFTIQKGKNNGGGGVLLRGNAVLENCIVQNNYSGDWGGGGILVEDAATDSAKIINCKVRNNVYKKYGVQNQFRTGGGGIAIKSGLTKAVIRGCIIEDNICDGLGGGYSNASGGGVFIGGGKIENSIIRNNIVTSKNTTTEEVNNNSKCEGGGIFVMPQTNGWITILKCQIYGNRNNANVGGGVSINQYYTTMALTDGVKITETSIHNNYSYKHGGGVFTTSSSNITNNVNYVFVNCIIANNEVDRNEGGGVFVNNSQGASVSFVNCNIVNNKMNTPATGGAGIFYNNIPGDLTNCIFWGNMNVDATQSKHHLRVYNVAGNKINHCAFDRRYVEDEINFPDNPTTISGLVLLENDNSGVVGSYVKFAAPTTFIGKAKNIAEENEMLSANWSIANNSACIDRGFTTPIAGTDYLGVTRPKGAAYEIGAYEVDLGPSTAIKNNKTDAFSIHTGQLGVVINLKDNNEIVLVYNAFGQLIKKVQLVKGENELQLRQGIYILKIGNTTSKILVQ